jgi:hypothetical protein
MVPHSGIVKLVAVGIAVVCGILVIAAGHVFGLSVTDEAGVGIISAAAAALL